MSSGGEAAGTHHGRSFDPGILSTVCWVSDPREGPVFSNADNLSGTIRSTPDPAPRRTFADRRHLPGLSMR